MGKMKMYFNKQALERLANELRRASWAVAVGGVAGVFLVDEAWAAAAGGIAWLVMQVMAVILESVKYED